MKIKRYVVNNMPEAMEIIRRDLGTKAVIISSRKVRKNGFWGFFQEPKLEVTAAVEKEEKLEPEKPKSQNSGELASFKQELDEVKNLLRELSTKNSNASSELELQQLAKWEDSLEAIDISKETISQLLQEITFSTNNEADDKIIKAAIYDNIVKLVAAKYDKLNAISGTKPKVIAFVGPPGVGKTTTLAKLAANLALFEKKKIGLITIDTYRIGAVEQMKIYGDILNVPVEKVLTPEELLAAINKNKDKDVIFIDTAGRPANNKGQLMEIKTFLDLAKPEDIFLVVSCTTKNKDLIKIVKDYAIVKYNKLIFTKLDETDSHGSILNVLQTTELPVAYITTGQNVPDDIQTCEPHKLAKLIMEAVD